PHVRVGGPAGGGAQAGAHRPRPACGSADWRVALPARGRAFRVIRGAPPAQHTIGLRPPEFDSYARKCLFLLERTFKNATTAAPTAPAPLVFLSLRHEAPRSARC